MIMLNRPPDGKIETCKVDLQGFRLDVMRETAENGHLAVMRYPVKIYPADPQVPAEKDLRAALYSAAENGRLEVLKYLIEEWKADPRAEGDRALVFAATGGRLAVVKYLITMQTRIPRMSWRCVEPLVMGISAW